MNRALAFAAAIPIAIVTVDHVSADTVTATYIGTVYADTITAYTPASGVVTSTSSQYVGDTVTMTFTRNTDLLVDSSPTFNQSQTFQTTPTANAAQVTLGQISFTAPGNYLASSSQVIDLVGGGSFPFVNAQSVVESVADRDFDGPDNPFDWSAILPYNVASSPIGQTGDFSYVNVYAIIGNSVGDQFLSADLNASLNYTTTADDLASGFTNGAIQFYSGTYDGNGGFTNYEVQEVDFVPSQLTITDIGPSPVIPSVPEPATWAMMLIGFAGVGFVTRNQERRQRLSDFRSPIL